MGILDKFLKKRGVSSPQELTPEERITYEKFALILSREEITIGDFRNFIKAQIAIIENRWRDHRITAARKAELIPYHTVYKTLLTAIDAPKAEREALEIMLNNQLQDKE